MAISAADVKKLREKTGAGMMDCKKALKEADGDFNRAEEILKELGLAAVAKRSGRSTDEGRIFTYVGDDVAGIMEISCETDFVARNEEFASTGAQLVEDAVVQNLPSDDEGLVNRVNELAATIKENMTIRRFQRKELSANQSAVAYIHGEAGSLGVLLTLELSSPELKGNEAVATLGKDLAMHAAAFSPLYLNEDAVESSYLAEQEKIFKAQAENMDKPSHVIEGIIKGKLKKHLKEICFTEQGFVKDDKRSVAQVLKDTGKEVGGDIKLVDYIVFRAGEEL
ncbi:translation elongation factor Ts [Salinispira pacifica]|uniref:Elongation factor Ts n=1 Tax=Salinispira pacifica TaxID=1307761 RepID=V5WFW5_9SPIO|nr:translation elongation factor Ts [Salinispira pacifica]AHC14727.1 Translation elongation factor Ts [Salinispira pacifica]